MVARPLGHAIALGLLLRRTVLGDVAKLRASVALRALSGVRAVAGKVAQVAAVVALWLAHLALRFVRVHWLRAVALQVVDRSAVVARLRLARGRAVSGDVSDSVAVPALLLGSIGWAVRAVLLDVVLGPAAEKGEEGERSGRKAIGRRVGEKGNRIPGRRRFVRRDKTMYALIEGTSYERPKNSSESGARI